MEKGTFEFYTRLFIRIVADCRVADLITARIFGAIGRFNAIGKETGTYFTSMVFFRNNPDYDFSAAKMRSCRNAENKLSREKHPEDPLRFYREWVLLLFGLLFYSSGRAERRSRRPEGATTAVDALSARHRQEFLLQLSYIFIETLWTLQPAMDEICIQALYLFAFIELPLEDSFVACHGKMAKELFDSLNASMLAPEHRKLFDHVNSPMLAPEHQKQFDALHLLNSEGRTTQIATPKCFAALIETLIGYACPSGCDKLCC